MSKPMLILESELTKPPRYYATTAYRVRDAEKGLIVVTGVKHDVTEQIERIIAKRLSSDKVSKEVE